MEWGLVGVVVLLVFLLLLAVISSLPKRNKKVRFGVFMERERFEEEDDDAG